MAGDALNLIISKEGTMTLQNQPVTLEDLPKRLKELSRKKRYESLGIQLEEDADVHQADEVSQIAMAANAADATYVFRPPSR